MLHNDHSLINETSQLINDAENCDSIYKIIASAHNKLQSLQFIDNTKCVSSEDNDVLREILIVAFIKIAHLRKGEKELNAKDYIRIRNNSHFITQDDISRGPEAVYLAFANGLKNELANKRSRKTAAVSNTGYFSGFIKFTAGAVVVGAVVATGYKLRRSE